MTRQGSSPRIQVNGEWYPNENVGKTEKADMADTVMPERPVTPIIDRAKLRDS